MVSLVNVLVLIKLIATEHLFNAVQSEQFSEIIRKSIIKLEDKYNKMFRQRSV